MTGVFDDDPTELVRPGKGLLGGGAPAVFQEATVVVKAPVGTTLESIPAPRPPAGEGDLTTEEKEAFEACKAGMNNLHNAFWVAGKSLETMATGDLHRNEGSTNFAEFVWANWEISESQVYRLMDEWRIGEALNQLGHRPRESQVRELGDIRRAAGDRAAVAVYDAVARTGKRVTAKLLEQVVRQLPPLTEELSPSQIGTMVRDVLTPPPASEGGSNTGAADGDQSESASAGGEGVHTITSLGQDADSPMGAAGVVSADVERLQETLALLREASRGLGKPAVRRALEDAPAETAALLAEIDNSINKIGRAVAVRRAD
ncbi:hypothetical protein [Streptomyces sp. GESEQ-35]|uniref:hypothetical protein n=1 Tax=Streptomyces sp. GESEQ-35 TaxID=2812657 RepID=UPI001B3343A2|nr:hypothetical protein [Streptomyces sp. GESEQ-35]